MVDRQQGLTNRFGFSSKTAGPVQKVAVYLEAVFETEVVVLTLKVAQRESSRTALYGAVTEIDRTLFSHSQIKLAISLGPVPKTW